jgi:hypothetical protein
MSTDIEVPATPRRAIELDGIHGTFRVEKCAFAIHYFSTFATPSPSENEEHYCELLKELKPMRERVSAKNLTDLNALLQRDLSDERIARELVPYLCGKVSKVGFFPPVLAVLVPSGFIDEKATGTKDYPAGNKVDMLLSYGKLWQVRYHGPSTRLARLSIFSGTEIIVIDGQHRSNAFRYVSDVMKPDVLHAVFYEHAPKPTSFASDLPVTIAWFEAVDTQKVQPNDISRELFVAVNNSAKTVSASRTILLDDTDPVCLAVNTYFSDLAKRRGFKAGGMNLLCACFDVDVDETMAGSRPVFALTDPVALKSATTYAFFGLDKYDTLERNKANRMRQTNKSRFERLFGSVGYIDTGGGRRIQPLVNLVDRGDFRNRVAKNYIPLLDALFQESALASCHHEAVKQTEEWIIGAGGSTTVKDAWDRLFCGGEGLFGQIQRSESTQAAIYRKAIKEIQDHFRVTRRNVIRDRVGKSIKLGDDRIEKVFQLFDTVACQTGIVMALSVVNKELHRKSVHPPLRLKKVISVVKDIKLIDWVRFFIAFDELYFTNLEANSWPRFQKLFVRLFCKKFVSFDAKIEYSPECEMIIWRASKIIEGFAESGNGVKEKEENEALATALSDVDAAFRQMGEQVIAKAELKKVAKKAIRYLVAKLERQRKEAAGAAIAAVTSEEPDDENNDQI